MTTALLMAPGEGGYGMIVRQSGVILCKERDSGRSSGWKWGCNSRGIEFVFTESKGVMRCTRLQLLGNPGGFWLNERILREWADFGALDWGLPVPLDADWRRFPKGTGLKRLRKTAFSTWASGAGAKARRRLLRHLRHE